MDWDDFDHSDNNSDDADEDSNVQSPSQAQWIC